MCSYNIWDSICYMCAVQPTGQSPLVVATFGVKELRFSRTLCTSREAQLPLLVCKILLKSLIFISIFPWNLWKSNITLVQVKSTVLWKKVLFSYCSVMLLVVWQVELWIVTITIFLCDNGLLWICRWPSNILNFTCMLYVG